MRKLCRNIAIAMSVGLTAACTSINCQLNNTVYTTYGFYTGDKQAITITDTLTVTAAGTDSVLLNRQANAGSMELPMSYTGNTDMLILHFDNLGNDTLWVDHTNYPYYETPECGTAIFHNITRIGHTNNHIDSIVIVKPSVNYDGLENVRIFFK